MDGQEAEIILARRTIDKLTKVIFDQDKTIKRQEQEIEDLLGQIKAFKPIVDAWSARQPAPRDDYYED